MTPKEKPHGALATPHAADIKTNSLIIDGTQQLVNAPAEHNPIVAKALATARAAAVVRLRRGADALSAGLQPNGVLFTTLWKKGGSWGAARLEFMWPGVLVEWALDSGRVISETEARYMRTRRRHAAAFLIAAAKGRPLKIVIFQPPGGVQQQASIYADGVVRVHGVRTGELLAESEPGRPDVLAAHFEPLTAADLLPRIH